MTVAPGAEPAAPEVSTHPVDVALAGNPNSGKTTLFNALTGLRQRVANYPGVTVEKKSGEATLPGGEIVNVIDLPGTYSLVPGSPDEVVTADVLRGARADTPLPARIVAVVDATNLPRNLFLVTQLIELRRPLVVALTMTDLAARRGHHTDAARLGAELGVPVIPVVASTGSGLPALQEALRHPPVPKGPRWEYPAVLQTELRRVAETLATAAPETAAPDVARRLLSDEDAVDLQRLRDMPEVGSALAQASARLQSAGIDAMQADIEARYAWIDGVVERVVLTAPAPKPSRSQRVDRVLMHRVVGLLAFMVIMGGLFSGIFVLADPLMRWSDALIAALGRSVVGHIAPGPMHDLLRDGVFGGVGGVLTFVPQIALLFAFLALLEDSGYLARAAFLMDRALARVGLHGKSFIPLLSSFACAIPGIMATRTIDSRRERILTIMVAPFMTCSARLPVYGLLIGALFPAHGVLERGGLMLGCYLGGIAAAAATAWVATRARPPRRTMPFILELPPYRVPRPGQVARHVWHNTGEFLRRAGTTIFFLSVILWALTYYPRLPHGENGARATAAAQLEHSLAGRLGRSIEPALTPLGYDWKVGVGLVGAFAAREVFTSHLRIIYGADGAGDSNAALVKAMHAERRPDGSKVWTPLLGLSLLVWFVLAMQCISTLAVVRAETGSWRWPLLQLGYMTTLAYVVCLIIHQVAIRLGGA